MRIAVEFPEKACCFLDATLLISSDDDHMGTASSSSEYRGLLAVLFEVDQSSTVLLFVPIEGRCQSLSRPSATQNEPVARLTAQVTQPVDLSGQFGQSSFPPPHSCYEDLQAIVLHCYANLQTPMVFFLDPCQNLYVDVWGHRSTTGRGSKEIYRNKSLHFHNQAIRSLKSFFPFSFRCLFKTAKRKSNNILSFNLREIRARHEILFRKSRLIKCLASI